MNTLSRSFWPGLALAFGLFGLAALVLAKLLVTGHGDGEGIAVFARLTARDLSVVRFSVFQAACSTVLSLAAGIVFAWALRHRHAFPGRTLLVGLLSCALVLPSLVVVMGLVTVLGRNGWLAAVSNSFPGGFLYGFAGILIAHVYLNASLVARSVLNRLEAVPVERHKLAASLGLSPWQQFRVLHWTAMRPVIPGLAATVFLLCFTSFAIVLTLGGSPKYNTLEVSIYEAVKLDFDLLRAVDLALLQLAICAVFVGLSSGWSRPEGDVQAAANGYTAPVSAMTSRLQVAIVAVFGCAYILPLLAVAVDGVRGGPVGPFADPVFLRALATSLAVASASAILTLAVSITLGLAMRNLTSPVRRTGLSPHWLKFFRFSASVYLVVPALVLALGFFLLARQLPGGLAVWSIAALIVANVLMALPFAFIVLVPALAKAAARFDRLGFSLGLRPMARWRHVDWPVVRPDIAYAGAIAFSLSLGDLGVIALFGTQDLVTLPWYLYQKMGSYRTDDAAVTALVLLILALGAFLVFPKLIAGAKR